MPTGPQWNFFVFLFSPFPASMSVVQTTAAFLSKFFFLIYLFSSFMETGFYTFTLPYTILKGYTQVNPHIPCSPLVSKRKTFQTALLTFLLLTLRWRGLAKGKGEPFKDKRKGYPMESRSASHAHASIVRQQHIMEPEKWQVLDPHGFSFSSVSKFPKDHKQVIMKHLR